ncbi:hypothetical protein FHS18_002569 [Paenibacillus phyllosphaerae]|uniref:Uncharacterized protein n=1 Tax=Paenibacillus phyllosphaerae TaxID=274593 RepID=A0A7W5FMV8_9BACL|nr:glycosyltransferase family A protein [Paenibacillus phyllosphaerae]MBB3110502.1 hypothetical protein [Paenibacillus phyllosphaerae]
MIQILLWVLGCYILAALCVHIAFRISAKKKREAHYVLVAGNEEERMEWYMRALRQHAYVHGKELQVTVLDDGSRDDTLRIAKLFEREGMKVTVAGGTGWLEESGSHGQGQAQPIQGGELSLKTEESPSKWQRLRGRRFKSKQAVRKQEGKASPEPSHLMWRLKAEGIVTEPEHAVLVDLREPSDWSKLPL